MEVGILNAKPETEGDIVTNINKSALPPTHPSLNKANNRNIHSASFGSGSSTCSSNSSSSLSTGGSISYSPAIRGHRDKYASSGRTLNNSSSAERKCRKNSNTCDIDYSQSTNGYKESLTAENGLDTKARDSHNGENVLNDPHSLDDYPQTNTAKGRGRRKCERVNIKNVNGNGDNAQACPSQQKGPSVRSSQNNANLDRINDTQVVNNYTYSASPGSNSGKL